MGSVRIASCLLLLPMALGCQESTPEAPRATITGAGSTFAAPIIEKWSEQYQKRHPDIVLEYDAVGSGEGESRFKSGAVDFGGTDAGLTAEQIAGIEGGAIQVPVSASKEVT